MERTGIEVLIVVDPANMNYLTGYDAWSFYTPQVVIVDIDKEEPLWIGRKMDAACATFTVWLSPDNAMGYPEDLVNHQIKHPMSMRPGDRTVLQKNMTFHVLVAMWMEGWGYTISEPTRVTETGCETFDLKE